MPGENATPAMIDRVAGAFGFQPDEAETSTNRPVQDDEAGEQVIDETTEESTEQTSQDDGLFDLEWEGRSYKLPNEFKEPLMRVKDYTHKTQELAEQRRAIEQVKSIAETQGFEIQFRDSIAAEQQDLGIIDAYLKQVAGIDWAAMTTEQMMRQKIEIDGVKERRASLLESINGKRGKFNSDMQARINELRGKAREIASKSIQGFGEDTEKTMREYAKSEGLSDVEIDNVLLDPRSFKMVWKAAQFDKIKAGTARAGEQAKNAANGALRPGVAGQRMPTETAQKLNFGKAMSKATTSSQKAQLIEGKLAGMFSKGKR